MRTIALPVENQINNLAIYGNDIYVATSRDVWQLEYNKFSHCLTMTGNINSLTAGKDKLAIADYQFSLWVRNKKGILAHETTIYDHFATFATFCDEDIFYIVNNRLIKNNNRFPCPAVGNLLYLTNYNNTIALALVGVNSYSSRGDTSICQIWLWNKGNGWDLYSTIFPIGTFPIGTFLKSFDDCIRLFNWHENNLWIRTITDKKTSVHFFEGYQSAMTAKGGCFLFKKDMVSWWDGNEIKYHFETPGLRYWSVDSEEGTVFAWMDNKELHFMDVPE